MSRRQLVISLALLAALDLAPAFADEDVTPIVLPIVNGLPTGNFPSVGQLVQAGSGCTATLIGCQTALTAAHCVCGLLPAARCVKTPDVIGVPRFVLLQHAGVFRVASVDVEPSYAFPQHDLAVLHLAEQVTGIAPASINTTGKPAPGTPGRIVGFGFATDGDFGIARWGRVTIGRCNVQGLSRADHDCWRFERPFGKPGTDSTTCYGDSGGPLFTSTPAGTVLSGVHSAADSADPGDLCKAPQTGIDADVFTSRNWIAAGAGEDLGAAACGGLPAAGTPQAPVLSQVVRLDRQRWTSRLRFDVKPGTTVLRVSLNAGVTWGAWELYVNHGPSASPTAFVCKSTGGDRWFKYCEVEAPAPGVWSLLARMTDGFASDVQETVTRFMSADGPH